MRRKLFRRGNRREDSRPLRRRLFATSRRRAGAWCLVAVIVLGLGISVFISTRHASAWWSSSWFYRRKITIDNSASGTALVNFPLLVSLTSSNVNYSNTQNSGQDIRFVDSDDSTPLSYEIEKWDEAGTSLVWVNVPQIDASSSTDFIYMYYGNASVADGQTPSSAWNSDFRGVWHGGETSGTTFADSTSGGNTATKGGTSSPTPTTGQIDGAQSYANNSGTSTTSKATILDSNSLDITGTITVSAWVRATAFNSSDGYETIMIKGDTDTNYALQIEGSNFIDFSIASGVTYFESFSNTAVVANTWYFLTATYDDTANQVKIYINGNLDATRTETHSATANNLPLVLGQLDFGDEGWTGIIDEARVTGNAQTADWIKAEYLTGTNAMNSFGSEEQFPPLAPTLTALTISETTAPVFQLRAVDQVDPTYLRYKLEICSVSDCSSLVRTVDQTSSQTGWSGQDAQTGTAYVASATPGSSTLATYTYQTPLLSVGTQYWWRAYAIDPSGSNTWSPASSISMFTTQGPPPAPTLVEPLNAGSASDINPVFRLWTTDINGDYLRYKIDVCSVSDCSVIVRTVDQTSSQTGWNSQNTQSATAYSADTLQITLSQQAAYVYQNPQLTTATTYWWRAYAIDPGGSNTWSPASSISSFSTNPSLVRITGGTKIVGGTKIGP